MEQLFPPDATVTPRRLENTEASRFRPFAYRIRSHMTIPRYIRSAERLFCFDLEEYPYWFYWDLEFRQIYMIQVLNVIFKFSTGL